MNMTEKKHLIFKLIIIADNKGCLIQKRAVVENNNEQNIIVKTLVETLSEVVKHGSTV